MNIRYYIAKNYMKQQFYNAKKYTEYKINNHNLSKESLSHLCDNFRHAAEAYATVAFLEFKSNGAFSETYVTDSRQNPVYLSSNYKIFIEEQEEWLRALLKK